VILIEMGSVTVNEAKALKLWSAVAKAVMVTVLPTMVGITIGPGTTKVVGKPDAECQPVGVQSTVPHVAFQSTPRFAGSPVTVAAAVMVAPEGADAGGG
jgi:hypothetical protein